jgi:DNA-binding MarR family transcriptional regulator
MSTQATLEPPAPPKARARLDADATALHDALSELVRVYQFRDRDRICCHDVSVTQCYAIEALIRRGPSGLNELDAELYLDKSTASRVVAALQRKRYVTRAPHPEDGRAIVLTATAAGRRLYEGIRGDLIGEAKQLLEDFEPEVRRGAAQLILRLARAAAARSGVGTADPSCCPPKSCG